MVVRHDDDRRPLLVRDATEHLHHGLAAATLARRGTVLDAAFLAHPERFTRGRPVPASLPTEVWINKPNPEVATEDAAQ